MADFLQRFKPREYVHHACHAKKRGKLFLKNPSPALPFQGRESRRAISAEAGGKFNADSKLATSLKLLPKSPGMNDSRLFTTAKTSRTRAARLPSLKGKGWGMGFKKKSLPRPFGVGWGMGYHQKYAAKTNFRRKPY
ncbi:MAG: hypothetical protein DA408_15030 [Bacteroidetes bacterium]|nr:MAG: hypothetical protein C7N36_06130 [Bacteroidota bacterium]PTM10852.1 MAG: hypothetical protein DA408_15030 [Bacteroidota bacterium]